MLAALTSIVYPKPVKSKNSLVAAASLVAVALLAVAVYVMLWVGFVVHWAWLDTALTHAASTAFPSGHALGMTVGVLAFLTVLWPRLTLIRRRVAVAVGVGLILTVSLARVILNVHHPSDVVAGWVLGFLYYLLCVRLVCSWRLGRRGRLPLVCCTCHNGLHSQLGRGLWGCWRWIPRCWPVPA
jgi:membrane-associated phospholipid phosphatase